VVIVVNMGYLPIKLRSILKVIVGQARSVKKGNQVLLVRMALFKMIQICFITNRVQLVLIASKAKQQHRLQQPFGQLRERMMLHYLNLQTLLVIVQTVIIVLLGRLVHTRRNVKMVKLGILFKRL
jgi:hypothetical protein